jgi:hypothetical protein
MWKEAAVACFNVFSGYLLGDTEKTQNNFKLSLCVSVEIRTDIYRIQVRIYNSSQLARCLVDEIYT